MRKNIAVHIGKNIAEARSAAGKKQQEVADQVGIDAVSLSRIERGHVTPSIATLDRIADTLEVPLGRLFDGISHGTAALSDRIASVMEPLSEKKREFLLEQMLTWAEWLSNDD